MDNDKEKPDIDELAKSFNDDKKEEEKLDLDKLEIPDLEQIGDIDHEEKKHVPDDKPPAEPESEEPEKIDLSSISFDLNGEEQESKSTAEIPADQPPEQGISEPPPPEISEPALVKDVIQPADKSAEQPPVPITETTPAFEEDIKPKKKKSKLPLILFLLIVIAGALYYFSSMEKKKEDLIVKKPVIKKQLKETTEVISKKIQSPYLYVNAENVQKDISEGIITYVYDTTAELDTMQKYYKQKLVFLEYNLKSEDYKIGNTYAHLIFTKGDKNCSVFLRSRDNKVNVIVSYIE